MSTSKPVKLSDSEIAVALPGWENRSGRLHREYKFADFVAVFGFMTGAPLIAQRIGHPGK